MQNQLHFTITTKLKEEASMKEEQTSQMIKTADNAQQVMKKDLLTQNDKL